MNEEELYAHPGWKWCTFEGARDQVRLIALETTFVEKLQWLEQAETLALQMRNGDAITERPNNDGPCDLLGPP